MEEELPESVIDESPEEEWRGPDASVAALLESENEEISLEGLNDLADGLDGDSDDIDVSFLDDVLDDDWFSVEDRSLEGHHSSGRNENHASV